MKIIYIAKAIIPSRTANSLHVMKMCQAFADNGHEVVLYVLSEEVGIKNNVGSVYCQYAVKNNFRIEWVSVIATKGSSIRYLLSSSFVAGSIARRLIFKQVDVVFGRDLLACTVSALLGKQTIYESHSPVWRNRLESILFQLFIHLPRFSRLIVISDALRQVYLSRYKQLNHKNTLIAHDAADIPSQESISRTLQGALGLLNVGYVGHLYKGKGVEVIAAVAPLLPAVNFHIIGGLEHDLTYWKSEISASNVFFYGFIKQDKLSNYIQNLDVCLLPNQRYVSAFGSSVDKSKNISDFTSPLKMFEYMAYKKPIVASNLPVLREVLNEKVALFAESEDIATWKAAIDQMQNRKLREQLGNAAYALFIDKYTWTKRANNVLDDRC